MRDYVELIANDISEAVKKLKESGLDASTNDGEIRVYFPDSEEDRLVVPIIVDALRNSIIKFTTYYDGSFSYLGSEFTEQIMNSGAHTGGTATDIHIKQEE